MKIMLRKACSAAKHYRDLFCIDFSLKVTFERVNISRSFFNEKVILTPDGVEVPLIFSMDNLRKRFNFLMIFFKSKGGGEELFQS